MLSLRAQSLKPSPTLALNALAKQLASQGKDIVSLAVGELDFDTFSNIKDAAKKALDEGFTKYVPADGILELRKAVVQRIHRTLGLTYPEANCMITPGGKQALYNILQVLCGEGDEVIIPSPYWVSYPTLVELSDAKPVLVDCPEETSFKLTPKLLEKALTSKTKVLMLNSPSNPTGQVYSAKELKDLASILEKTKVWVISDDIYDQIVFDGENIAPHIACQSEILRPRVLLTNSMSKTYAMTGWRIGSVVGDKKVVDACSNFQSQASGCGVSFSQKAAVTALNGPQTEVENIREILKKRRDLALARFSKMKNVSVLKPGGAFYLFVSVKNLGKSSAEISKMLIESEGVVVVPGEEFGAPGYLRLSYALSEARLAEGLDRMSRLFDRLKS